MFWLLAVIGIRLYYCSEYGSFIEPPNDDESVLIILVSLVDGEPTDWTRSNEEAAGAAHTIYKLSRWMPQTRPTNQMSCILSYEPPLLINGLSLILFSMNCSGRYDVPDVVTSNRVRRIRRWGRDTVPFVDWGNVECPFYIHHAALWVSQLRIGNVSMVYMAL